MGDEKVEVINIKNVLEIIYKNILVFLLITVIIASISFIVSKVFLHKEYRSSVSLYVMNNKVTQNTGEILSSDISASQMLVNTYAVILSDNLVMEDISNSLIKKYGADKLSKIFPIVEKDGGYAIPSSAISSCISMGSVNETEVLRVMATTRDPQVSVDICLAMIDVAPKVLSDVMGVAYVNPIGYPELMGGSSSPNVLKNVILGGGFGFILSVALVLLLDFLNNTVTDGESLVNKFGVPVLGEIPVYDVSGNNETAEREVNANA